MKRARVEPCSPFSKIEPLDLDDLAQELDLSHETRESLLQVIEAWDAPQQEQTTQSNTTHSNPTEKQIPPFLPTSNNLRAVHTAKQAVDAFDVDMVDEDVKLDHELGDVRRLISPASKRPLLMRGALSLPFAKRILAVRHSDASPMPQRRCVTRDTAVDRRVVWGYGFGQGRRASDGEKKGLLNMGTRNGERRLSVPTMQNTIKWEERKKKLVEIERKVRMNLRQARVGSVPRNVKLPSPVKERRERRKSKLGSPTDIRSLPRWR